MIKFKLSVYKHFIYLYIIIKKEYSFNKYVVWETSAKIKDSIWGFRFGNIFFFFVFSLIPVLLFIYACIIGMSLS